MKNRYTVALMLALIALAAVVFGVTFLAINLPNYREARPPVPNPGAKAAARGQDFVQFTHQRAVWDKDDKDYPLEVERGSSGFYVFPFQHPGSQAAELGLFETKCDCAKLMVGLIEDDKEWQRIQKLPKDQLGPGLTLYPEPTWQELNVDKHKGVLIPAGAKGLVRLGWNGRKDTGSKLGLNVLLWVQPEGQADQRLFTKLDVPAVMAPPLQFSPLKLDLGVIGVGETATGEFTIWSATRPRLDLTFSAKENHPLEFTLIPLAANQVKALRDRIKKEVGLTTHLQCAYSLKVRAPEPHLNLGTLYKPLVVHLDGFPLDGLPPVVEGRVKADIDVGGPNDRSKVQFDSFRAQDGASKEIGLWSDAKINLTHHDQQPKSLQVTLTKDDQASTGTRTKWRLEVMAPPNGYFGPFPENSAVWLRLGDSQRLLRIPVTGNAGS